MKKKKKKKKNFKISYFNKLLLNKEIWYIYIRGFCAMLSFSLYVMWILGLYYGVPFFLLLWGDILIISIFILLIKDY